MSRIVTAPDLKLAWQGLLDLLYPPHCLICTASGTPPVCDRCHKAFLPLSEPVCAVCGRPTETAACALCEIARRTGGWGFDAARACGVYQGPLREAIHRLKFQRVELLGDPLGQYLATRAIVDNLLADCLPNGGKIDALVPVPLHPAKQRQRGYNQSALIAAPLAEMLEVPLLDALVRPRKSPTQVGLTADARRGNVSAGSFIVRDASVAGKTLVLVDDVFTTGTTLSAGAAALKAAGASRVIALALSAGG